MKLNLENAADCTKAGEYLGDLLTRKAMIELREIKPRRSKRQNAYLHAIIDEYAMEAGYTTAEAKTVVKTLLGYTYEKDGVIMLRETSKMDSAELSEFTDRFRNLAAQYGVYLMSPDEFEKGGWKDVERRRDQMRRHL